MDKEFNKLFIIGGIILFALGFVFRFLTPGSFLIFILFIIGFLSIWFGILNRWNWGAYQTLIKVVVAIIFTAITYIVFMFLVFAYVGS